MQTRRQIKFIRISDDSIASDSTKLWNYAIDVIETEFDSVISVTVDSVFSFIADSLYIVIEVVYEV